MRQEQKRREKKISKESTKNLLSKPEGCWQLKNKEEEKKPSIAWGVIPIRKKSWVTDISSGTD